MYAGARFLINTNVARIHRKKTQKNIYFCLWLNYLFIFVQVINKTETK